MIRLAIADDHPVIRAGVRRLLDDSPDIRVLVEADTGDALLAELRQQPVDVAIVDISMPGPDFFDLLRRLTESDERLRVLAMSAHPEEKYAVRALRAGAAGYLEKGQTGELVAAIRRVHAGKTWVSPSMSDHLIAELRDETPAAAHDRLSDREYQVLRMVGQGKSGKEIAAALNLSPKTVSTYRTRILEKLGLQTTADLIRYVVDHELTDEP